jgi:tetratricopeptide (TPR) repeat protein
VIGETTMRQYQDTDKSYLEIAEELNVETLLIASVSFAEQEVAIDARLIDPRADRRIWSNSMFYPFEDVFSLRSEVAMLVANAMLIEYSAEEQQSIQQAPTDSGEAYDLYLAGREFLREGTADGAARGVDRLTEAVALDDTYVDAWISKSNAHFLASVYDDEEREFHSREGLSAIEMARALDPDNPGAIAARAFRLLNEELNAVGAYSAYLRARELNGQPIGTSILLALGYIEETVAEQEQALILDPLNGSIYDDLIQAHDALGNADRVRYLFDRAKALGANTPVVNVDYLAFLLGNADPDEIRSFGSGGMPAYVSA